MNRKQNESGQRNFIQTVFHGIRHIFLHNGWFKLLAVLISLVLWAGLISQDESLTREKVFNNVAVTVSGADTMKRNGYIITSDLDAALSDITATAAVPQKQYEAAEVSAYNIRLDLSRIAGTGEQEVRLLSSPSTLYGRTTLSPASIRVNVEDYIIRYRIPVWVNVVGEPPPGWYISPPSADAPLVAVSGPKDLVNTISRARVFVDPDDIEWFEGTTVFSAPLHLYNRAGEEIVSNLLEISYDGVRSDSVVLEATIYPTASYEITDVIKITSEVADGYQITDVHVSPETVTVAAREEVLLQILEQNLLEHSTIDVSGLTENSTFQIRVVKPSDDAVLLTDTITVTVDVEKLP